MEDTRVAQFALLFAGLTRAKGRYVSTSDPSQLIVGDKAKGRATTITEEVTVEDYRKHLAGELGLGIVPIRDDGTCVFGAIDIDQYAGLDHQGLVTALAALQVPAMVCRSKSGGAHVQIFIQEPGAKAPAVIEYLKNLRSQAGIDYRKAREIFPKQAKQQGGIGNWINLPYFGESARKAIKADGSVYSLEEFLDAVVRLDPHALELKGEDDSLLLPSELPPCLERLVAEGIPNGQRNEALFNFTVFAAKKFQLDRPSTIKMLDVINTRVCQPPVQSRELATTLDSVLKHEYNYRCDQSPLVDYCDRAKCSLRPFGPPASMRPTNIPEIERIEVRGEEANETLYYIKLKSCPKVITCKSSSLLDYDLFRKHVLDTTHTMMPSVRKRDWDAYITARWAVLSETIRVAKERTRSGMSESLLDDWIRQLGSTEKISVALGNPYIDEGHVYVSLANASRRLKAVAMGSKSDLPGTAIYLEDNGWVKVQKTVDGHIHNLWTRPVDPSIAPLPKVMQEVNEVGGGPVMTLPVSTTHPEIEETNWSDYGPQEDVQV